MKEKKTRRVFPKEFKQEAVKLATEVARGPPQWPGI